MQKRQAVLIFFSAIAITCFTNILQDPVVPVQDSANAQHYLLEGKKEQNSELERTPAANHASNASLSKKTGPAFLQKLSFNKTDQYTILNSCGVVFSLTVIHQSLLFIFPAHFFW